MRKLTLHIILAMLAALLTVPRAMSQDTRQRDDSTQLALLLVVAANNMHNNNPTTAIQNYFAAKKKLENIAERNAGKNAKLTSEILRTNADINYEIGNIYASRGHFNKAKDCYHASMMVYQEMFDVDAMFKASQALARCEYNTGNLEAAAEYYDIIKNYYLNNDMPTEYKQSSQFLSDIYINLSRETRDPDESRQYLKKASTIARELFDYSNERQHEALDAFNNVAYCEILLGNYNEAIQEYGQIMQLDEISNPGNISAQAISYTNRGMCYQMKGDTRNCMKDLQKAAELRRKEGNPLEISKICNIIALIYMKDHDLHSADIYAQEAVTAAEKASDIDTRSDAYDTYAEILRQKGEPDKSITYKEKYIALKDSIRTRSDIKQQTLAQDLQMLQDAEKKLSEDLLNQRIQEKNLALLKSQQEKAEADRQRAEESRRVAELQKEQMKKANELLLLQNERMRQDAENQELKLRQAEDEQQRMLQERQIAERDRMINEQESLNKMQKLQIANEKAFSTIMIIVVAVAALLMIAFLYFFLVIRKKNKKLTEQQKIIEMNNADLMLKNEEIIAQKENLEMANAEILTINAEIEKKNKSITDSILYAKRIQQTVCTVPAFMKESVIENFVLFRPRDIVSGDFFWFHQLGDTIYAVAADCTGHGVPGAFMSMLGLSTLSKVVTERNILSPELILDNMRTEIKAALHQNDLSAQRKDGMDMSIVSINTKTHAMRFAGANNDGFLLQRFSKSEEELAHSDMGKKDIITETDGGFLRVRVIPSDPMPIGVYANEREHFTLHEYAMRKGDTIYMSSDGYIDQFGGPQGRKFLAKNFSKLLTTINSQDMQTQKQTLEKNIIDWMGDKYKPIDDVVVMGLRMP